MFVKPGTGPSPDEPEEKLVLKVRDPVTRRLLPEDGAEVPDTSFWRRLLRDGDVVKAAPPVVAEVAPAAVAAPQGPEPAPAKAAEATPVVEEVAPAAVAAPQGPEPAPAKAAEATPNAATGKGA